MPLAISVSETRYFGPTSRADELPIWGVVFQINRDDGIGTAIGITVRSDDEADARAQALSKLQGFLSEASAAAAAFYAACGKPGSYGKRLFRFHRIRTCRLVSNGAFASALSRRLSGPDPSPSLARLSLLRKRNH